MRLRSIGAVGAGIVLAALVLGANCVDGVTPDCSSDASQCGPSAVLAGEAGSDAADAGDADASRASDATRDAIADADAGGG